VSSADRRRAAHRARIREAVCDYMRRHGRVHRQDDGRQRGGDLDEVDDGGHLDAQLAPVERCAACDLLLVEGATAFDPNPAGGDPRRWWCRSCALVLDDRERDDETGGTR